MRTPISASMNWRARLRDSGRRGRLIIGAALTFVVMAGGLTAIQLTASTSANAATGLGECSPDTIFNLAGTQAGSSPPPNGALFALDVNTGQNTQIGQFSNNNMPINGLAVTPNLSMAFAVSQSGSQIYTLDNAGMPLPTVNTTPAGTTILMGGYDPVNMLYYYAGYTGGANNMIAVYAYNPSTMTALGRVANIPVPANLSSGDLAFDSQGNMYVVAGTNDGTGGANTAEILKVDGPLPKTGPPMTLTSQQLASQSTPPGQGFYNGIAFGANGVLYAQYSNPGTATLVPLDPSTAAPGPSIPQQGEPTAPNIILDDLAGCSTPATLIVQKNLPNNRAATGDQFTLTIAHDGAPVGHVATTAGNNGGLQDQTASTLPVPGQTYQISENLAQGTATSPSAYDTTWSCVNGTETIASGSGPSFPLEFPEGGQVSGANVVCTFTNTPAAPTLTLTKAFGDDGRVNPGDQFTMQIHTGSPTGPIVGTTDNATSQGADSTVTDGTGTTTVTPADAGPYFLTEAPAGTTTPADYTQDIECRDTNQVQTTGLPSAAFTGSASVTPVPGSAISCVLTNTPVPPTVLQLNKALGSDRVQDSDQFTVAIRPGSPTADPLEPTGDAEPTTTGTGSTVDPNTGTTGFVTASVGTQYFLTETGAGTTNLNLYTSSVTCTDLAGVQTTGLPHDVPLSDNPSVTVASRGSEISCTLTNTARQPTLTVNKALGSDRVNAGDQFTTQILDADQMTVVGDTANATTQGSGAAVTDGTGTTTLSPATAGDTLFVNEVPAEGSTTNAEQYTSQITCTDANGVQTDLPSGAPFEGPLQIMPVLGAEITCTITNTAVAPGLLLSKALGSDRVNDTDQFMMQITDPTGAVVGTTDNATTTGTGSVVDAGSGTTELAEATAGTAYTLTEVPAGSPPANPADYTATITCADSQGLQPGLPDNAPFIGSITITPVGAASISCTVTNTAVPVTPPPTTPPAPPTPTPPATTPPAPPKPTPPATTPPALPEVPVTG